MANLTFDWDDIRFFLALYEQRTLSATARVLRVSHVTVSRRLANLENAMGVPLFERRPDGYVLTPAGQRMHGEAQAMSQAVTAIESKRMSADLPVGGKVLVTATRALADTWLADQLALLRRLQPNISFELLSTDRTLSLARREADIALRMGRPEEGELIIRRVATIAFDFYAAPGYLIGKRADEFAFIGYEMDSVIPEARWMNNEGFTSKIVFRTNSLLSQCSAATRGAGIALLPRYLGDTAMSLVRANMPQTPPPRELWLVTTSSAARLRRVRIVIDHLATTFEQDADMFLHGHHVMTTVSDSTTPSLKSA